MKKYTVVKFFTDLKDNKHAYHVGDTFPRDGLVVTQQRFAELAGKNNRQGTPLIEEIKEPAATKRRTRRKKQNEQNAD